MKKLFVIALVSAGLIFTGCKKDSDKTAPVITVKSTTFPVLLNGTYTPETATVNDETDGDISSSVTIDKSKVIVTKAGSYTVTYTAKDKAGNEGTLTVNVVVIDLAGDYTCKIVTDGNYEYLDAIAASSTPNRAYAKKFAGYTDAAVNFDVNGNSITFPAGEKYMCGPTDDRVERTFTGSGTFSSDFKTITFTYTAKATGSADEVGTITYTKK